MPKNVNKVINTEDRKLITKEEIELDILKGYNLATIDSVIENNT